MSGRSVTALDDTTIGAFKGSLRGELLQPGDAAYEGARKVWNGMVDRHPALIVRCAGVADVIEAVRFGRAHNLLVAVRGGGHNVAGNAVCDGGMVIDLSPMKGIRVDPQRRVVRAQGGVTWGELDRETQAFGLATTGGEVSSTGIAGLTLGGGLGWLMGKYGLSCDNLLSADVVTADGRFLMACSGENDDLFWGVRGGGGNFGIVTSFEYQLHPVRTVLGGMILYPSTMAKEVLRRWRDCTTTAPDELTLMGALLTAPDGIPMVGAAVCYCGPPTEGERLLQPLRSLGAPVVDLIRPMPYTELQTMLDATVPSGRQNYWKASFVDALTDEAIDVLVAQTAAMPSPYSSVLIEHLHGAVCRVDPDATAFGTRQEQYSVGIFAVWLDPAESAPHVGWARQVAAALARFDTGRVYVNYLGEEGEPRVRAAYRTNYERLVTLKNKYDPTNFFRVNQNIPPRERV
jgi:FAD/FMN-containing dehydrogenase